MKGKTQVRCRHKCGRATALKNLHEENQLRRSNKQGNSRQSGNPSSPRHSCQARGLPGVHWQREVQSPSVCHHSRWEGMRQSERACCLPTKPTPLRAPGPGHIVIPDSVTLSPKTLHTSTCVSMSNFLTALVNHQTWHSELGKEVQKVEVTEKPISTKHCK